MQVLIHPQILSFKKLVKKAKFNAMLWQVFSGKKRRKKFKMASF